MPIAPRFALALVVTGAGALLCAGPSPAMVGAGLATAPGSTAYVDASTGPCTGTLIAPSVVMTAAHCLDGAPTYVRVRTGTVNSAGSAGESFDAVRWTANPDAAPPLGDLGYIDLGSDSTATRSPAQGFLPPAGYVGLGRGFGLIVDGAAHQTDLHEAQVQVATCPATIVAPTPTICTKTSPQYPASVCRGDSGGPFLDASGTLIAVASQASEGCSEYATYTPFAGNLGFLAQARAPRLTGRVLSTVPGATVDGGTAKLFDSASGSLVATAATDDRGFQAVVDAGTYDVEASAPGHVTRRYESVRISGPTALSPVLSPASSTGTAKARVASVKRRRDGRLSVRVTVIPAARTKPRLEVVGVLQPTTKRGKSISLGSVKVTVRKKGTITVTIAPKRSVRARATVGRKVRIGVLSGEALLANTTLRIRKG